MNPHKITEGPLDPCPDCDGADWPYSRWSGTEVRCTTCGGAGVYKLSGPRATAFHCLRIARHLRKAAELRDPSNRAIYIASHRDFLRKAHNLCRAAIDERLQTSFLPA